MSWLNCLTWSYNRTSLINIQSIREQYTRSYLGLGGNPFVVDPKLVVLKLKEVGSKPFILELSVSLSVGDGEQVLLFELMIGEHIHEGVVQWKVGVKHTSLSECRSDFVEQDYFDQQEHSPWPSSLVASFVLNEDFADPLDWKNYLTSLPSNHNYHCSFSFALKSCQKFQSNLETEFQAGRFLKDP